MKDLRDMPDLVEVLNTIATIRICPSCLGQLFDRNPAMDDQGLSLITDPSACEYQAHEQLEQNKDWGLSR